MMVKKEALQEPIRNPTLKSPDISYISVSGDFDIWSIWQITHTFVYNKTLHHLKAETL